MLGMIVSDMGISKADLAVWEVKIESILPSGIINIKMADRLRGETPKLASPLANRRDRQSQALMTS